jgi:DNA (cytosine-5)-methyltransferase 1
MINIKMTKIELLEKCKNLGITKCKSKTKAKLIELINNKTINIKIQPVITTTTPIDFTFIDLFCGIGGFHQAMTKLNGKCVFACDINEDCRKTYEANYGITPEADITKINIDAIPNFDVLCGGFPCQPFSKAGNQKGFADDRGNLFFNICKIIIKHNPKYLILENVRNLASHDGGNTWKTIYDNIISLGYYTYPKPIILNALHFDVPQNRERVIILCVRKDLHELPLLPIIPKNCKKTLTVNIKDIILPDTYEFTIEGKLKDVEIIWNNFMQLIIMSGIPMPKFPIWTDYWDTEAPKLFYLKYKSWIDKNVAWYTEHFALLKPWLEASRLCDNWSGSVRKFEWQAGDLQVGDSMNTVLWSCRGSGIRVKRCDYIPTLVAMAMTPIYGPESRRLSPKELLRLQSFEDGFIYNNKNIYKQVGNSVNVKMIEASANFLMFGKPLLQS